jgi:CheY-like chemotaxis protein
VLVTLFAGQSVQRGERIRKHEFDKALGQRLPLRVLVAEDVPVNQQMMRVMLARMGYVADFADNGREALRALERRPYDLIFMDMQMPEMDGLECSCEISRRYPAESRPVIVALTANVTAEDAAACKNAGMDDFLTKPVKPMELCKCLELWGQKTADKNQAAGSNEQLRSRDDVKTILAGNGSLTRPQPAPVVLIDEAVVADLRELDDGAARLLQGFVVSFQQAVPEHVALMQQALAAGEGEQLRKVAHRLKGLAANVGACGVAEQCRLLEELAKTGLLGGGAALVAELEQRVQATAARFVEMGVAVTHGECSVASAS